MRKSLLLILAVVLPPLSPPGSEGGTVGAGAHPERLTTDGSFKQHLHYSSDGKRLYFTRIFKGNMRPWSCAADGSDMRALIDPDPKTPCFDAHPSPDGKRIVYVHDRLEGTDGKLQINLCDADGKNAKVLVPHKAFEETPRFSPDGKTVAWVSTRHGNQEIYATTKGDDVTRLTNDANFDNNPAWSPDGKLIAFSSSRSGNFEIHVMNADGTGVKRLTNNSAVEMWPAWSPDGKRIAFTSNRDGNYEIYSMAADGSDVRNETKSRSQDNYAAYSPDGTYLAFVSDRRGGSDVYRVRVK